LSYDVRILLQEDITNINARGNDIFDSSKALLKTSVGGYEEIIETLLHKGVDVNTPGEWNSLDALGIAYEKGHDGIATRLLNEGANSYIEQGYRETALAISCRKNARHRRANGFSQNSRMGALLCLCPWSWQDSKRVWNVRPIGF
jgi:hypothetical protein